MNQDPNFEKSYYFYQIMPSEEQKKEAELKKSEAEALGTRCGTISMVLGIVSLGVTFFFLFGLFGIATTVLSIISLVFAVRSKKANTTNRLQGKAIAGLVCSIVALVFATVFVISLLSVILTAALI